LLQLIDDGLGDVIKASRRWANGAQSGRGGCHRFIMSQIVGRYKRIRRYATKPRLNS